MTSSITVYAIKHLPTGFYLPEVGQCYTRSKPQGLAQNQSYFLPRLFRYESSARKALAAYAKGEWGKFDGYPEAPNKDERNKADFAVVQFQLTEQPK